MKTSNIFSKIAHKIFPQKSSYSSGYAAIFSSPGEPIWMKREYSKFAEEAYQKNVIAHRAITMIASSAAGVKWQVFYRKKLSADHALAKLLARPHPHAGGAEFFENIYAYRLISGNAYIQAIRLNDAPPQELYCLRPDRVAVIPGSNAIAKAYRYYIDNNKYRDFIVDPLSGKSDILHIRYFHPLNDWYGLSPIEAAAYSIDQHNQSAVWNQSLLQNGARPSGALVMKNGELSDEQYERIKRQVEESYTNPVNSGRPLLLEGGMEWKEMSLSSKDMDFIEAKNCAAREIALAFGVPPQLLGIPGDNTYSNFQEARLALWEETILPMLDSIKDSLNNWLAPMFGSHVYIDYDKDNISALTEKRENIWQRLENANFLTINEKRAILGFPPIETDRREEKLH